MPASRNDAARFLTQATFGPTDADIDRLMAIGYSAWIDEQFAKPASSNLATWDASDAAAKLASPTASVGISGTANAFWKTAIMGDDQLRQRVAYALSQIFVISLIDSNVINYPRAVSAYVDMLGTAGLTTYRQLLESVALHPMMGTYLSSIRNQKADVKTGRVPDENFAREAMQLMSVGLHQLNADGSEILASGQPVDTFTQTDVGGLAKVFTGWSWSCATLDSACFNSGASGGVANPDRSIKNMVGYAAFHSGEAKTFLGTTIAAQPVADPAASLKSALDTLASHPNVGPFIGRQLIQRLVTSNPSPAYVAAVAAAFNGKGAGARGDMKAVVKAILMHPEARVVSSTSGKLREPVLRLSAYLRAFPFTSDTGFYQVGITDDAASQLGQTPMRAPSVFNFYRPGYVAAGSLTGAQDLTMPELQVTTETSVAGYVNYMAIAIAKGLGQRGLDGTAARPDVQPDYTGELALSATSSALVDRVTAKLLGDGVPDAYKAELRTAVDSIVVPTLKAGGSNQAQVDAAKRNRVQAAVLLTLASPEFIVQK